MMDQRIKAIYEAADYIRERTGGFVPKVGIILGSGLGKLADSIESPIIIPYAEIPRFSRSTAIGHKGNLILGTIAGKPVCAMQGRFHYYEGYPMPMVVFPTRVLAALGIRTLIVTNASGSLRENLSPASLVLITDHINFMGTNPLIGINDDNLGERFPSLNNPYDPELCSLADEVARELEISTFKGTYIAVTGPSLETKAECNAVQV